MLVTFQKIFGSSFPFCQVPIKPIFSLISFAVFAYASNDASFSYATEIRF